MTPLDFYTLIRPALTDPQARVIAQHLALQVLDYISFEAELTNYEGEQDVVISIRVDFHGGGYQSEQFFVQEDGRVTGYSALAEDTEEWYHAD